MAGDVFVVEDESCLADIYHTILESIGFNMAGWAQSGEEAMEKLAHSARKPDLIIMDNRLPGMSGIDATAKILEIYPNACILFVSADDHAKDQALRSGAVGFLQKPFTLEDFISSVTRYAAGPSRNCIAPVPFSSPLRGEVLSKVEIIVDCPNGVPSGNNGNRLRRMILSIRGIEDGLFKERIVRHMFMDDEKRIRMFSPGSGGAYLTMAGLTSPEAERIKGEVERILDEES